MTGIAWGARAGVSFALEVIAYKALPVLMLGGLESITGAIIGGLMIGILEKLFEIVREVVASHPRVLSGDAVPVAERPDAEIEAFGDSGIDILVEFWMEGIDDGENRVGADLLLMIWTALKANDIEIPFPQREVKVLGEVRTS